MSWKAYDKPYGIRGNRAWFDLVDGMVVGRGQGLCGEQRVSSFSEVTLITFCAGIYKETGTVWRKEFKVSILFVDDFLT